MKPDPPDPQVLRGLWERLPSLFRRVGASGDGSMMDGSKMDETEEEMSEAEMEKLEEYFKTHPFELMFNLESVPLREKPMIEIYGNPSAPFMFAMSKFGHIAPKALFDEVVEAWGKLYEFLDETFIHTHNIKASIEVVLYEYLAQKSWLSDLEADSPIRNPGYIYVIHSNYGYKIGRTKNYTARMKLFEVKLPFEFKIVQIFKVSDMTTTEAVLHRYFTKQEKHINGEWFTLDENDLSALQYIERSKSFQYGAFGNEAE